MTRRVAALALALPVPLLLACGGGSAAPSPDGTGACPEGAVASGTASFYTPAGQGACSFTAIPSMGVALPPALYASAARCGACLRVTGPRGSAVVRVEDLCPECPPTQLDLTADAFPLVADPVVGIEAITFREVACPDDGPVRYRLQGTNAWYLSIVVENPRFAVATLEVRPAGAAAFGPMARASWNAFQASFPSAISGPLALRVTDVHGHVLTDSVPLQDGLWDGAAQLPATCP